MEWEELYDEYGFPDDPDEGTLHTQQLEFEQPTNTIIFEPKAAAGRPQGKRAMK